MWSIQDRQIHRDKNYISISRDLGCGEGIEVTANEYGVFFLGVMEMFWN